MARCVIMMIRAETLEDHDAIEHLLVEAFGGDDEARLVRAMRADDDLAVGLVAEADGRIAGYLALSPMQAPTGALGLAPVAVTPELQRRGIGSALIQFALVHARALDASIIFVLGDPAYYQRFGFSLECGEAYQSAYSGPHFMALPLGEAAGDGPATYARAFDSL